MKSNRNVSGCDVRQFYPQPYREINRYAPLTEEQKKGLSDKEIFMREYGLYTSWIYDSFWVNTFKEIYGYMPE